jgi:Holliday junction resolvasome RuvABC endonuclease subunit
MKTVGIDASTTNCGMSVFHNGIFHSCHNYTFGGVYNEMKLHDICRHFIGIFELYRPQLIIIEEPAPVRFSRAVTSLNQVAGAIFCAGVSSGATVNFLHNKTVKKFLKAGDKEE